MNNYPEKIILHCADTPNFDPSFDILDINQWHIDRGWKGCGYHYVITVDGAIQKGREENERGAHCAASGGNNNSLGICYMGRDKMTKQQLETLLIFIPDLLRKYKINVDKFYGHYEFDERKTCPNQDMLVLRTLISQSLLTF